MERSWSDLWVNPDKLESQMIPIEGTLVRESTGISWLQAPGPDEAREIWKEIGRGMDNDQRD